MSNCKKFFVTFKRGDDTKNFRDLHRANCSAAFKATKKFFVTFKRGRRTENFFDVTLPVARKKSEVTTCHAAK